MNLASIGVNLNNDGTLTVDSVALNDALTNHSADVKNFFQQASPAGFATHLKAELTVLNDPTSGLLYTDLAGIKNSQDSISRQIDDFEVRMAAKQDLLTREYVQIDVMLRQLPLLQASISGQLASLAGLNPTGH